ncbi:transaldolase family protein [Helicobacter sp. 23-1044]
MDNFSLWCDFVEREFLQNEFRAMIGRGEICGATSNPAIFANAILNSVAYKSAIEKLRSDGHSAKQIYENLAFSDIKSAATSLLPLWERNYNDGFISIEIDPMLCDDAAQSIDEGRRIFECINMPNVMIKVPATRAGFEVMSALYKDKININATLIFSQNQVQSCLDALGSDFVGDEYAPKAVISVFVSRFDRFVDSAKSAESSAKSAESPTICHSERSEESQKSAESSAKSAESPLDSANVDSANVDSAPKLGIYNAMKCYEKIERFGSPHIRTLFASTGVKGDALFASYYVANLLLPRSINTAPLPTIQDFVKQKCDFVKVPSDVDEVLGHFSVEAIAQNLLNDGLSAFQNEFEKMLKSI